MVGRVRFVAVAVVGAAAAVGIAVGEVAVDAAAADGGDHLRGAF